MLFLAMTWASLSLVVIVVTVFSATPGKSWILRVCDFPRAQMLWLGGLLLAGFSTHQLLGSSDNWLAENSLYWPIAILLVSALMIQAWWAIHFTSFYKKELAESEIESDCFHDEHPEVPHSGSVRIITANVDFTNTNRADALRSLLHWRPHILALCETDEHWNDHIFELEQSFPYVIREFRELGRGMTLLSSFPIEESEIRYLVDEDRPSIWAKVCTPNDGCFELVVLHPPPPGLPKRRGSGRHSSKKRDIELSLVAHHISKHQESDWIVTGDFNDVGWSATTRNAKNISGLKDPRVGRGMYSTFPARVPFLRYPIDHVLVSESFKLIRLERLSDIGSDHLPLLVDLELPKSPSTKSGTEQSTKRSLVYSTCDDRTREK